MTIPYTFAGATTAIPLAQLDANFASPITLGNVAMTLSNTYTSIGNLTLANVTITSGTSNVTQNLANVTGTLAVTNGGTGITSLTAGYIPFGNGTGAFNSTANFFYDSANGRLGINTVTPNAPLHIFQSTGTAGLTLQVGSNYGYFQQDGTNLIFASNYGTTGAKVKVNLQAPDSSLVIDSSGNIGIGTASPARNLSVYGTNATIAVQNSTTGATSSDGMLIQQVGNDSYLWNLENSFFSFGTNGSERMRISSAGAVSIGTTGNISTEKLTVVTSTTSVAAFFRNSHATSGDTTLGLWIDAAKDTNSYILACINNNQSGNGQVCNIYANGNIQNINNSYGALSDAKLKENIVDATPKLDDLMKVKVRNYNLIGDTTKQIGVVAQELETVFAGLVEESIDTDKEGNDLGTTTKSVKYSVFVPMLIKAIQEQQAIIEQLKAKVGL